MQDTAIASLDPVESPEPLPNLRRLAALIEERDGRLTWRAFDPASGELVETGDFDPPARALPEDGAACD